MNVLLIISYIFSEIDKITDKFKTSNETKER